MIKKLFIRFNNFKKQIITRIKKSTIFGTFLKLTIFNQFLIGLFLIVSSSIALKELMYYLFTIEISPTVLLYRIIFFCILLVILLFSYYRESFYSQEAIDMVDHICPTIIQEHMPRSVDIIFKINVFILILNFFLTLLFPGLQFFSFVFLFCSFNIFLISLVRIFVVTKHLTPLVVLRRYNDVYKKYTPAELKQFEDLELSNNRFSVITHIKTIGGAAKTIFVKMPARVPTQTGLEAAQTAVRSNTSAVVLGGAVAGGFAFAGSYHTNETNKIIAQQESITKIKIAEVQEQGLTERHKLSLQSEERMFAIKNPPVRTTPLPLPKASSDDGLMLRIARGERLENLAFKK